MTMTDAEYRANRARFGTVKTVYIRAPEPKLDPLYGEVVEKRKDKRGRVEYGVRFTAGVCPCSECGHAGDIMLRCEVADCGCHTCRSLCC